MTLYTFLFLVGFKRKKIQKAEPDKFLDYFNNLVSYEKSKQLELVYVARLICYLTIQIESHNNVHFFVIVFREEYVGSYFLFCVRGIMKSYC